MLFSRRQSQGAKKFMTKWSHQEICRFSRNTGAYLGDIGSKFYIEQSQWNPRRSRGASVLYTQYGAGGYGLSGTPAEAGVRVDNQNQVIEKSDVSVEPPPKQGCERLPRSLPRHRPSLSGTPAEAGVREGPIGNDGPQGIRLSGTPAEAGVRG